MKESKTLVLICLLLFQISTCEEEESNEFGKKIDKKLPGILEYANVLYDGEIDENAIKETRSFLEGPKHEWGEELPDIEDGPISESLDYVIRHYKHNVRLKEMVDYMVSKYLEGRYAIQRLVTGQGWIFEEAERLILEIDKLKSSTDINAFKELKADKTNRFNIHLDWEKTQIGNKTTTVDISEMTAELEKLLKTHEELEKQIRRHLGYLEKKFETSPNPNGDTLQDILNAKVDYDLSELEKLQEAYSRLESLMNKIEAEPDKENMEIMLLEELTIVAEEKIPKLSPAELLNKHSRAIVTLMVSIHKRMTEKDKVLSEMQQFAISYFRREAKKKFLSNQFDELMREAEEKFKAKEKKVVQDGKSEL